MEKWMIKPMIVTVAAVALTALAVYAHHESMRRQFQLPQVSDQRASAEEFADRIHQGSVHMAYAMLRQGATRAQVLELYPREVVAEAEQLLQSQ